MSADFNCSRCGQGFDRESMKSTPNGNLFCPTCWPKVDAKSEALRNCPVDGTQMEKRLIEELVLIDECPSCSGVWLDQGELKLIRDRSSEPDFRAAFLFGLLR